MLGLLEDLLLVREVPAADVGIGLNRRAGADEFVVPLVEHLDAGLDVLDRLLRLLLGEDRLDVDLFAHHLADLVRDGLKNVLELIDVDIDMAGDRPDQLEAVIQRLHRLSDGLQDTLGDDLELTLKCSQELYEVLSHGLVLLEVLAFSVILIDDVCVLSVLGLEQGEDFLNSRQVELLTQCVEGGRAVRPVFELARGGQESPVLSLLLLLFDGSCDFLGPVFL